MNTIHLTGRLGKDIETRNLESGKTVSIFTLATSRKVGSEERTQWHNIVAWGPTGETLAKYIGKGDQLSLSGEMQYREYEKDGIKRRIAEVHLHQFTFVGTKKD